MNKLQKIFDEALKATARQIKYDLILKKFQEAGISLTDEQLEEVLKRKTRGAFTLELDDEQVANNEKARNGNLQIITTGAIT